MVFSSTNQKLVRLRDLRNDYLASDVIQGEVTLREPSDSVATALLLNGVVLAGFWVTEQIGT
jgi:hypothetical protein